MKYKKKNIYIYIYQFRNTKLKTKTNNAYLMSQNHHQILENDRLPMERERERERWYRKKQIQSNKQQIKKKIKRQLVIIDWKTKRLYGEVKNKIEIIMWRTLKTLQCNNTNH